MVYSASQITALRIDGSVEQADPAGGRQPRSFSLRCRGRLRRPITDHARRGVPPPEAGLIAPHSGVQGVREVLRCGSPPPLWSELSLFKGTVPRNLGVQSVLDAARYSPAVPEDVNLPHFAINRVSFGIPTDC